MAVILENFGNIVPGLLAQAKEIYENFLAKKYQKMKRCIN